MSNLKDVLKRLEELESSAKEILIRMPGKQHRGQPDACSRPIRVPPPPPRLEPDSQLSETTSKGEEPVSQGAETTLTAKKLRIAIPHTSLPELRGYQPPLQATITAHIESLASLRKDIEAMIQTEGKRSFWSGVWVNAAFFVLGIATSAVSLSTEKIFTLLGLK